MPTKNKIRAFLSPTLVLPLPDNFKNCTLSRRKFHEEKGVILLPNTDRGKLANIYKMKTH